MIILENYKILSKDAFYYVVTGERVQCPDCGGPVKVRDSKRRKLIMDDESVHIFKLRRLKCQVCGALHLEMPDCMLPNKHYCAQVIKGIVEGNRNDCPADDATIYRWKKEGTPDLHGSIPK